MSAPPEVPPISPAPAIPTVEEIERTAALSDSVIRNLQITQSYHELALAMTARTGVSKQAGRL